MAGLVEWRAIIPKLNLKPLHGHIYIAYIHITYIVSNITLHIATMDFKWIAIHVYILHGNNELHLKSTLAIANC